MRARAAYVCFLSNPQNLDIGKMIAKPSESPFAKSLASAKQMMVVPNRVVSIYSRIWCVFEAFLAYKLEKRIYTAWSTPPKMYPCVVRVCCLYLGSGALSVLVMPLVEHNTFELIFMVLTIIFMFLGFSKDFAGLLVMNQSKDPKQC